MKHKMTWFLLGATYVVTTGITVAACSSSSTTVTNPPGDSGTGGMDSTAPTGDTGTGATDTGTGTTDTGTPPTDGGGGDVVDCGEPGKLHPETEAGVFCPFSAVGDGGDITCAAGMTCCQPTAANDAGVYPASSCVANGTACPTSPAAVWECEDPIDCTGGSSAGPVCCMAAAKIEGPDPGCNYQYASKFTGTHCAASCTATEFVVCETNAECGDAGTCNPAKIKGNQVGTCGTL